MSQLFNTDLICIPIHEEVAFLNQLEQGFSGGVQDLIMDHLNSMYVGDGNRLMPSEVLVGSHCTDEAQYSPMVSVLEKVITESISRNTILVPTLKLKDNPLNGILYMDVVKTKQQYDDFKSGSIFNEQEEYYNVV